MAAPLTMRSFATAAEFEQAAIAAAADGALILCATPRLARRLLHAVRRERLARGAAGWETPAIHSLRGWLYQAFLGLWPASRPVTPVLALRLWHEGLAQVRLPDGLTAGPALYHQLQESLDILLDAGLDPLGGDEDHALAWVRRRATAVYLDLAARAGVVLRHDLVATVAAAAGTLALPRRVCLAGFDELTPLDARIAAALAAHSALEQWMVAAPPRPDVTMRLFAAPNQECRAVCAEALDAWNCGVRHAAIVFADRAWFPLLKRCLDDLAGTAVPDFERAIRYNLTEGLPLREHPLFQVAQIPLRLAGDPAPARLLTDLLLAPYARAAAPGAADPLRDALWEPDRLLSPVEALDALERHGFAMAPLRRLVDRRTAPLAVWVADLQAALEALGFVRFDGQHRAADVLARQHVDETLQALAAEAGDVVTTASEALGWLRAAAERKVVSVKTPEIAGLQVLSPAEAHGLAFARVWVVGAHGGALPAPAREWPFLDPNEQRRLPGFTLEQQWERGRRQCAALLAAAPAVRFSRAAAGDEDTPYAPCPLIPDAAGPGGQPLRETYALWDAPSPAWMRARWLRGALTAVDSPPPGPPPPTSPLPAACSVTALQDLAACPFLFLCRQVLRLKPLELPEAGIDPRARGQALHAVLRTFAEGLAAQAPDWPEDDRAARAWLDRVVRREFAPRRHSLFWRVEEARLLGSGDLPGLLPAWLDQERDRARAGWRFARTEIAFSGLQAAGLALHGRVDRLDVHPAEGWAVWDYKSGAPPSAASVIGRVEDVQLPAYLLALLRGALDDLPATIPPPTPPGRGPPVPVQAGYIALRRAAEVKIAPLTDRRTPVDWPRVLPEWEQALRQRLDEPRRGRYPAAPRPGGPALFHARSGACEYCEFFNLCGFFDAPMPSPQDEPDEQG